MGHQYSCQYGFFFIKEYWSVSKELRALLKGYGIKEQGGGVKRQLTAGSNKEILFE